MKLHVLDFNLHAGSALGVLGELLEDYPKTDVVLAQEVVKGATPERIAHVMDPDEWRCVGGSPEPLAGTRIWVRRDGWDHVRHENDLTSQGYDGLHPLRRTTVSVDRHIESGTRFRFGSAHPWTAGGVLAQGTKRARDGHIAQVSAMVDAMTLKHDGSPVVRVVGGDWNERDLGSHERKPLKALTARAQLGAVGMVPSSEVTERGDTHANLDEIYVDPAACRVVRREVIATPRPADHPALYVVLEVD